MIINSIISHTETPSTMLILTQTQRQKEWLIHSSDPESFHSFFECFSAKRGVKTIRIASSSLAPSTAGAPAILSSTKPGNATNNSTAPWVDPLSGLLRARVNLSPITLVRITDTPEEEVVDRDATITHDDPWAAHLRKSPESHISALGLKRRLSRAIEARDEFGSAVLNEAESALEVRLSRSASSFLLGGSVGDDGSQESVFVDVGDSDEEEDPFAFPVTRRRLEDLNGHIDDDSREHHDPDPAGQSPETRRLWALAKMPASPLSNPPPSTRVFASHSASSCSSAEPNFEGASSGYDSLSTPGRSDGTVGFDDDDVDGRGRFTSTNQILAGPQFSPDRPFSPARLGSSPLAAIELASPSRPHMSSEGIFPITTITTPDDRRQKNMETPSALDATSPSASRHFSPQVLCGRSVFPSAGAISVLSPGNDMDGSQAADGVDEVFLPDLNAANLAEFTLDHSTEEVFADCVDRGCGNEERALSPRNVNDGPRTTEDAADEENEVLSPASSNFSFRSCQSAIGGPIEVVEGKAGLLNNEHSREMDTEDDSALGTCDHL